MKGGGGPAKGTETRDATATRGEMRKSKMDSSCFKRFYTGIGLNFNGLGSSPYALESMGFVPSSSNPRKDDVGIALVRQNVRGDLVQEPTIVRNTNSGAVPGLNGVLEASKGGDIKVGRLVEKQTVACSSWSSGSCNRLRSPPERLPTFFC